MRDARAVVTDSGGIQEETTYLDIPCITLRTTTERPITVELGTNQVVGESSEKALRAFERAVAGNWKHGSRPPLWDGAAGERIVEHLLKSAFPALA
jgi:UDP-N-acetylglucosamine 2-epimerase (non-hydrolysing)